MRQRVLRSGTGVVVLLVGLSAFAAAQPPVAPAAPRLTPAEMQAFLESAHIVRRREAGDGVTGSLRVTLSDERLTHDAHVQTVDESATVYRTSTSVELNFKDTYRYNIAGYRLAQLIGLTTVPMSVRRVIDGHDAAVTWWLDDVLMDEKRRRKSGARAPDSLRYQNQLQMMRVFDELIQNRDRNQGNMVWTRDWTLWLIDHTRAFRLEEKLLKPNYLTRCERGFFERLQAMTEESLEAAVGDSLNGWERKAVLARRDLIVKFYQARIARFGEPAVLFESRRE